MKEPRQSATCYTAEGLHKHGYSTRHQARKAARSVQSDIGRVSVYRGDCGLYHFGHGWWDR